MKVLMLTHEYPPSLVGGLGTHSQELARGLVRLGVEVTILSFSISGTTSYVDRGVYVQFLKFPFTGRKNQYDGEIHEVSLLAAEVTSQLARIPFCPDIIHVHEWLGYSLAAPLVRAFRRPVVLTMHALWSELVERWNHHPEGPTIRLLERRSCQGASRVIAVSQALADDIHRKYGVARSSIRVIHNGLDTELFEEALLLDTGALDGQECDQLGKPLIIFAGRITAQKGVVELVRSAADVIREYPNVRYVIVGDEESMSYTQSVRQVLRGNSALNERVFFGGKLERSRLKELYRTATMAVVPSLYEPFGYAAIEPMALGTPVVAYAVDGLKEVIENEVSGLLVPLDSTLPREGSPKDIQRLANAQLRLLRDETFAKRLGRGGKTSVLARFQLSNMVSQTVAVYKELLAP